MPCLFLQSVPTKKDRAKGRRTIDRALKLLEGNTSEQDLHQAAIEILRYLPEGSDNKYLSDLGF